MKKTATLFFEAVKWAAVIWLLWPIHKAVDQKLDFARILLGILLFIIFIGKYFYDSILDRFKHTGEQKGFTDVLIMVGVVAVIALLVGLTILFIAMFVIAMAEQLNQPSEGQ